MTMTACARCLLLGAARNHQGRCYPTFHSPNGEERGTAPLHPGKTARDRARGHARKATR